MIVIIALALSGVSIVISLVTLVLLLRRDVGGNNNSDSTGTVYCPNCCQPFDARMKNCPKCGLPKKKS